MKKYKNNNKICELVEIKNNLAKVKINGEYNFIPQDVFEENWKEIDALSLQEGGDHYKDLEIQPIEFIAKNNLDFLQGNIIKYATRHKNKNGAEDIRKIKHYCDLILKLQYDEN